MKIPKFRKFRRKESDNKKTTWFAVMKMTDEEADEFESYLRQIEKSDFWKTLNEEQRRLYAVSIPDLYEEFKKRKSNRS